MIETPLQKPGGRIERTIDPSFPTERLDKAIAALLPDLSRARVQQLIRDGRVSVNGEPAGRTSEQVSGGARIVVDVPPPAAASPQPEALPLRVLYDDADLIVIDKPAGMVVHPAAGHLEGTLVNALLHHVKDLSGVGGALRPGIVHRLDKGTSGVMMVAKHDRAHRELTNQFSQRTVEKEYIALVWGKLKEGLTIEAPIGRDPRHRQRMSVRAIRARTAETKIVSAEPLRGVTLARVAITTGRTHQIRVHLQSIGHPVVGDPVYGGVRKQLPADLRALGTLERPFLHAARLAFTHPSDGRRIAIESPLADDLAQILDVIRKT